MLQVWLVYFVAMGVPIGIKYTGAVVQFPRPSEAIRCCRRFVRQVNVLSVVVSGGGAELCYSPGPSVGSARNLVPRGLGVASRPLFR